MNKQKKFLLYAVLILGALMLVVMSALAPSDPVHRHKKTSSNAERTSKIVKEPHRHRQKTADYTMSSGASSSAKPAQSSSAPVPKSSQALQKPAGPNLYKMDGTEYPSEARSDAAIAPIRNEVGHLIWNGYGAYVVNSDQPSLGSVKSYGRPWAQNHTDSQGRPTVADAYLTKQARQYRSRQSTGNGATSWKPAGYQQQFNLPGQYRFAYNRGHLLGYALVGNIRGFNASEANHDNIAAQTMWANQAWGAQNTGQNYYEGIVRRALDQNKFVRYQVRDWYFGNDEVPRATQIQAESSDGSVRFNVLVPNTQNNILINYSNGAVTRCN